jgi:hypothetical protein
MKSKTPIALFQERILQLETVQESEYNALQGQFHEITEKLKPGNIIKNTFHNAIAAPESHNALIDNILGIATGFLSRRFLFGASTNPVKKMAGNILQFGISNIVYKNSSVIKAIGGAILQKIFSSRKPAEKELPTKQLSDAVT